MMVTVTALAIALVPATATAASPWLTARAAVLMDARTGQVLWERNGSEPLPPASTTKVMTAVLALESHRLADQFVTSSNAADTPPSKINLRPGQRMRLEDLLYAVLLKSANDAAEVVAEGLAGSETAFAVRMNDKAQELGARTAHFVNPHGLSTQGHVASARDLAVIFRHALGLPLFREILETRSTRVPVESGGIQWVSLHSHNRLLTDRTYQVIGKTGYTRLARRCFVGAATHDDRELIIAVLGARDLWGDAKRLLTYGFGGVPERPPVVMASALSLPHLPRRRTVRPVVEEGDDEAESARAEALSRFAVQLGPYRTRRQAATTRARLARRGYTAILSGRILRLGSFSSPGHAERFATRLRLVGYRPAVVAVD